MRAKQGWWDHHFSFLEASLARTDALREENSLFGMNVQYMYKKKNTIKGDRKIATLLVDKFIVQNITSLNEM